MRRLLLMAVLIFAAFATGQDRPFASGELLKYDAGFRWMSVGTTTLGIEGGDSTLIVTSKVRTYPLFDKLYKINDHVEVQLDSSTLQLRKFWRNINEGSYHRLDSSHVDEMDSLIYTRKDTLAYEPPIFDPIGAIYYLRTQQLSIGKKFNLSIFDGKRVRPIAVEVQKIESIKVPAGQFECYRLVPAPLDDKPMTKVRGFLQLWLTTDDARIPARIEQRTNFGTMVLKLSSDEED